MIIILFFLIVVTAVVMIFNKLDSKQVGEMELMHTKSNVIKKLDKAGYIFNILLSILYVPISWFSWLLLMASEGTIDATNSTYIILINVFCWVSMSIPFLCFLGIFLSARLRKRSYSIWSFIVQFIPLAIFCMNVVLLFIAESVPAVK